MSKLIILMDATLDQLQSVEGIDNEMAIQILEVRDASHFIDFNAVSGITGVPKSTLKKYFIEPGMLFFYQKIHNDLVSFRQEIKQDLSIITSGLQSIITSGLQEEDKTMAEVDKTEETTGTSGIRLTEMETSQLIKSTTQFQNHIPLLQDEHREVPEKLDTLIKHKNQQVEEQFGTQPKCLSTSASSTPYQDFSVVSPISKSTSYFMNKDIMGNPCASAETTLKIDTAPRVVQVRVRPLGSRLTQEEESHNELVVKTVGRSLDVHVAVNSIQIRATIDTAVLKGTGLQLLTDILANSGQFTIRVIYLIGTINLGLHGLIVCRAMVDLVRYVLNSFMFKTMKRKSLPEDDYDTLLIQNHLPVLISHVMEITPQYTVNIVNNTASEISPIATDLSNKMVSDENRYVDITDETSDNHKVRREGVSQQRSAGAQGPAASLVTAYSLAAIDRKLINSYWSLPHQCFVCGLVTQAKMGCHVLKTTLSCYFEPHTTCWSCEVPTGPLTHRHAIEHREERSVFDEDFFGASLCWVHVIKLAQCY
ncbi:unnamed protein product [Mytilus edulis]|uniref:Uncharacterized protein n=1 Tax=Mytilus edulis TaxID=6550 RepID=A0A8S3RN79_MYTED|nr:unnamed protein product [Mytilus edulis]